MSDHNRLEPAVPWVEVVATEADWDAADPSLLTSMFSHLTLIRSFEERVATLFAKGDIPGFVHLYAGEKAVA